MEHIDKITESVGRAFRSFGGGQEGFNNPIVAALKDEPLQFAAGVDIKEVVEYVFSESGHDDLLEIANMVKDMPPKNDVLFDAHCANLRKKAKQAITSAQDAPVAQ